ncbi:MAG: adenylyltransferase/cytidyltransferase family protein [Methanosarcina sp.]|nr:adenylyltransferase/cytidyltransferase family protein [Methanosarcina sp.]
MVTRGFFIGRFQPFHFGHLSVVRYALEHDDELIVAIGSTDKSFTTKDPFTASERFEMILAALAPYRDRVIVTIAPSNPLVQALFERDGYNVISLKPIESRGSGTQIRQLMIERNDAWKNLVPRNVVEYICDNNLEERVK